MAVKLSCPAPYFYGEGAGVPELVGDVGRFDREPSSIENPGGLVWKPNGPDEAAAQPRRPRIVKAIVKTIINAIVRASGARRSRKRSASSGYTYSKAALI
jgi:hypothetical protein